jgi:hypothetical protein
VFLKVTDQALLNPPRHEPTGRTVAPLGEPMHGLGHVLRDAPTQYLPLVGLTHTGLHKVYHLNDGIHAIVPHHPNVTVAVVHFENTEQPFPTPNFHE